MITKIKSYLGEFKPMNPKKETIIELHSSCLHERVTLSTNDKTKNNLKTLQM